MKATQHAVLILGMGLSLAAAHPGHDSGSTETPAANSQASKVEITVEGDKRVVRANGLPNHATGDFPNPGNPNSIRAQNYLFRMPAHPATNAVFTPVERQPIGVAVNGVVFDPGTAEYWKKDPSSGWRMEGIVNGRGTLGMDRNMAHVQPNGAYHYHGVPTGLVEKLPGDERKLIGYAADGFPIYTQTPEDRSGYRLKSGTRPGGSNGPGGKYDGTYTQDFEFVAGAGTLDEANGRSGVTGEYPQGTYFYVATEEFPFYPRMLKGTPDSSFQRQGPGSNGRPPRRNGTAGGPIGRLDRDGDGKISKEEAPQPMARNFSKHDTNGDGFIDAEEAKSLPRPPGRTAP
ncbi:MAG: YHYH protein [Chthoniobacterales bacterium]|nr:YHYH protein [Chthoniobacterales bacterium]